MRLKQYIDQIEKYAPDYKIENPKVSKSTVGWQLDHSLKVINGVVDLLKTAPTDKQPKLKLLGRFCLLTNYIPRGRGKAPKTVLPPEIIEFSALTTQIETAKRIMDDLKHVSSKATFKHPYFGILSQKQTVRFLEIHTKHHLKIVRDILKK